MTQPMMIGEVALTLGMTRQGVRALEHRGHLISVRTVGGWRIYSSADVERVRKLRARRKNNRQTIHVSVCTTGQPLDDDDRRFIEQAVEYIAAGRPS